MAFLAHLLLTSLLQMLTSMELMTAFLLLKGGFDRPQAVNFGSVASFLSAPQPLGCNSTGYESALVKMGASFA